MSDPIVQNLENLIKDIQSGDKQVTDCSGLIQSKDEGDGDWSTEEIITIKLTI